MDKSTKKDKTLKLIMDLSIVFNALVFILLISAHPIFWYFAADNAINNKPTSIIDMQLQIPKYLTFSAIYSALTYITKIFWKIYQETFSDILNIMTTDYYKEIKGFSISKPLNIILIAYIVYIHVTAI